MADSFFSQLKKRNVFKVGAAYIVLSWLILQVADLIIPALTLPEWVLTLLVVLLILGFPLALFLAWAYEITPEGIVKEDASEAPQEQSTISDDKSIAVMPFFNMSDDPEQIHFCDGLTEEMLNVLVRLPDLRVASRTSCFACKNKDYNLQEIAEKLSVSYILEGSVRKSGDNIRITAQLIDTKTDSHLWSETYDRQLNDIFAIQDDISIQILNALQLKLVVDPRTVELTHNPEAYEFYLRGISYKRKRGTKELLLAINLFQKALDLDNNFTLAWIRLAEAASTMSIYFNNTGNLSELAMDAADRAMGLSPNYAESYIAKGIAYLANDDYQSADVALNKSVELDPELGEAYLLLGRSAYLQQELDEAIRYFKISTEKNIDDYESPLLLIGLFKGKNDIKQAKKYAEIGIHRAKRELEDSPDNQRVYYLGTAAYIALENIEQARVWAERAVQIAPDDGATRYNVACFYSNIGEIDTALDHLEQSITSVDWLTADPDMDPLREHPRFHALINKLSAG